MIQDLVERVGREQLVSCSEGGEVADELLVVADKTHASCLITDVCFGSGGR